MTLLVGSIFHMTRKIVSEMTYNVSMGTLNLLYQYYRPMNYFRVATIDCIWLQVFVYVHSKLLYIIVVVVVVNFAVCGFGILCLLITKRTYRYRICVPYTVDFCLIACFDGSPDITSILHILMGNFSKHVGIAAAECSLTFYKLFWPVVWMLSSEYVNVC